VDYRRGEKMKIEEGGKECFQKKSPVGTKLSKYWPAIDAGERNAYNSR